MTKAFELRDTPELLCEFLWRFHLANPAQRGHDPTIAVASEAEEQLFKRLIREHAAFQLGIGEGEVERLDDALSEHYESGKVMKVEVYERGCLDPDFHLVSVPLTCSKSLFGHCTRAYWSVKLTEQNEGTVCFLKDTWREDIDSTGSEGSIYEEMGNARVENICDLILHGDVPSIRALDEVSFECCSVPVPDIDSPSMIAQITKSETPARLSPPSEQGLKNLFTPIGSAGVCERGWLRASPGIRILAWS